MTILTRPFTRRAFAAATAGSAMVALPGAHTRAQSPTPSSPITLWHGLTGESRRVLEEFVLPTWSSVNFEIPVAAVAFAPHQLKQEFEIAVKSGSGPDLLIAPSTWLGELVAAGVLGQFDDFLQPDVLDSLIPASVEVMRMASRLFGLPSTFETIALFVNTDLVDNLPTTTDDLLMQAKALHHTDSSKFGLALLSNFYHPAGFFFGFGGRIFDEQGRSGFDTGQTVDFLEWLAGLVQQPGVYQQNDAAAIRSLFIEARAAMVLNGPWAIEDYTSTFGSESIAVTPLPAISEIGKSVPSPFLRTSGVMINARTNGFRAQRASEFAQWYVGPVATSMMLEHAGLLPTNLGVDLTDRPYAQAFAQQAMITMPEPVSAAMQLVWEPAGTMISNVLENDRSPVEAAEQATTSINAALSRIET